MTKFIQQIRDLGPDERPREKLVRRGVRSLSDAELIALLLSSGYHGASALDVARQLLRRHNYDLGELARQGLPELVRQPGIGRVRATQLVAAMELGRRRESSGAEERPLLQDSADCFRVLRPLLTDLDHEEFHLLCLNRANRLLGAHVISRGGTTATVADAKNIFRCALSHPTVTSLVLAHNHPSGQAFPSEADRLLTRKLTAAARTLDLQVLDHLIVAGYRYYSFADHDRLAGARGED